jgi:hypothetical protein
MWNSISSLAARDRRVVSAPLLLAEVSLAMGSPHAG